MMSTEIAGILSGEVHLIVVGTHHHTADIVAVGILDTIEVTGIEIVVRTVFHTCRYIHVIARAVAAVHRVKRIGRTILIGLVGIDTLRIGEAEFQTLQNVAPSKVVAQASVDIRVRVHILREVTIILQHIERIVLVSMTLAIAGTIYGNCIAVHLLRNITRTCKHQVIVLFCISSTYLQQRFVLLAIVTTDGQVSREPLGNLHIDTGAVVPAVVIQLA